LSADPRPMPRRPKPRLLGAVAAAVLAVAAALVVFLLLSSGSASSSPSAHHEPTYGGIPKWLPKTEKTDDRIVPASGAKPALAIQGNTVAVHLPGSGKVLVTAVGPEVPEEGEFPVPATSPCTFVVTFARASRAVPIDPADFTVIDEEGHLHHPKLIGMEGGPPPADVPAGETVSLKVHGVFPTGDGGLRWAPAGGRPAVTWDFDVEID